MKRDEIFKGNLLLDFSEPYQLHEPRRIWEKIFFPAVLRIWGRCTKTAAPETQQYGLLHPIL